jgi:putative phosphoribosyl transferase
MRFRDRTDAGRILAARLSANANRADLVVLALPRGGVPVAAEVARALAAPLDVFVVRKLGVPGHPELAMGATASGGIRVLNEDLIAALDIAREDVDRAASRESVELQRRDRLYRGQRERPPLRGRTIILVDDGLATGATMEAAVVALRAEQPARIIVAAPVAARESAERLTRIADEVVCVATPEPFQAVGLWYEYFDQTTDQEVIELVRQAARRQPVEPRG